MWVQREGLLEVINALVPVSFASGNQAEGHWYLAAAWQHCTDATEGGFRSCVIIQYPILIVALGEQGLGRVRFQFLRVFQSTYRCIASSRVCWIVAVENRVHAK